MLAEGKVQRAIARIYGIPTSNLSRHARHLKAALFRDTDAKPDISEPKHYAELRDRYADKLRVLEATTGWVMRDSKRHGKHDMVLKAVREQRENHLADAKLRGCLPGPAHQELHLHLDPDRAREIAQTFLDRRRERDASSKSVPKSLLAAGDDFPAELVTEAANVIEGHCTDVELTPEDQQTVDCGTPAAAAHEELSDGKESH